MTRHLKKDDFQLYLDLYFVDHIYPRDLGPMFNLSSKHHNRRIRYAIWKNMTLSDGTPITLDLYLEEKSLQDKMQGEDIMESKPDLVARLAKMDHPRGPIEGRWSKEDTRAVQQEIDYGKSPSEIHILGRSKTQVRSKYYHILSMNKLKTQQVS